MATIAPIVTFFIGLTLGYLAHWLALRRDKRKEFNEAAKPILTWLLAEQSAPNLNTRRPSELEMHTFKSYLAAAKREEFEASLAEYESVCEKWDQDSCGDVSYSDPERVRAEVSKLLPFTSRR